MIFCKYFASYLDYSGYGSAGRAFIIALFKAGVNVSTELVVQVAEKTSYGWKEAICNSLKDRNIPYKVKILHCTPDMYPRYMESGKYHIGHLFWETDQIPKEWVDPCNKIEEIWTASERMKKMIENSGVKCIIHCFPQPVDTEHGEEIIAPFETRYKKDFTFYSIFQWIERKNPRALVRSYWKAFQGNNDVTLLLKTYRVNYSPDEYNRIKEDIETWRKESPQDHYPKIFLVEKLLQDRELPKLHMMGDCYVNTSSGEGWNRPLHEAMLYRKPVISADNGGITDYLNDEYYYRVLSRPVQARQSYNIPWYLPYMKWWDINEEELIRTMRYVYDHREEAGKKADKAKAYVMEKTSYQTVGEQLKNRLEEIYKII